MASKMGSYKRYNNIGYLNGQVIPAKALIKPIKLSEEVRAFLEFIKLLNGGQIR